MKVSGKKNHRFETAKFGSSQLERSFNLGLKTGLVPSRVWIYEHTFSHISILTRFSSLMKMPATQRWWEYSILWTNPREGRGACLTRGSSPISPGHGTTGRRSSRFFLQGLPLGHTCTNCCPASNSHTISLLLLHLRAFHSVPLPSLAPLHFQQLTAAHDSLTSALSATGATGWTVADTQDWTVRKEKGSAVREMRAVEESDSTLTQRD